MLALLRIFLRSWPSRPESVLSLPAVIPSPSRHFNAVFAGQPLAREDKKPSIFGGGMAKLLIKSEGFHGKVLELNLGVNRFGRVEGNDFQIEHPTISAKHCEVILGDNQLIVRDCGSTNGTFIDGQPIGEARLSAGQTLRIGDVELLVETTEVNVAIPKFDTPHQGSPVVLSDGRLVCPRHKQALATPQCTHCP